MRRTGRLGRGLLLSLSISVALVGTARAQEEPELTIESVDISAFPDVRVTVAPPLELAGKTIDPKSFSIKENGAEREVRVTRLGTEELDVVVIVDTSGSMEGGAMLAAKASAFSFVDRLPEGTNVAVVGFGSTPQVASPFTTDKQKVASAIDGLVANGETALYDAVVAGADLLVAEGGEQRAIVLLSDGGDTVSSATITQAQNRLSAAKTGMTVIALQTDESDAASLNRLAGAAEGRVVAVEDPGALDAAYGSVAERLSNLYELRFFSSGATRADLTISVDQDGVAATLLRAVEFPDRPLTSTSTTQAEIEVAKPFVEEGSGVSGTSLLIGGAVLVALGLAGGLAVAFVGNEPHRRLAREYEAAGADENSLAWLSSLANRATEFSSGLLERGNKTRSIDAALDRAGLKVRAGELLAGVATSSLATAMLGFLVGGPVGLLVGLVVPLVAAPIIVRSLQLRRQRRFSDQLGEALLLLAGSLRAGHGLVQAIDSVAREADAPMADEFGRVVTETRLGRDITASLADAADRVDSEDFRWVVEAMEINREIGGDLAEVLDHLGDTTRARARVKRQVRALSAEGRISAVVLFLLPFAVGFIVAASNPDYVGELFTTGLGRIMLAVAGSLLVIGALWLRKIVNPEF